MIALKAVPIFNNVSRKFLGNNRLQMDKTKFRHISVPFEHGFFACCMSPLRAYTILKTPIQNGFMIKIEISSWRFTTDL